MRQLPLHTRHVLRVWRLLLLLPQLPSLPLAVLLLAGSLPHHTRHWLWRHPLLCDPPLLLLCVV
jgi:hypothetical protein